VITVDIAYNVYDTEYIKTIECDYIREYRDHFTAVKRLGNGKYLRWWINKSNIVYLVILEKEEVKRYE